MFPRAKFRSGLVTLALAAPLLVSCDDATAPLPADLLFVPVVSGLDNPLALTAPTGDSRLFIVQQNGLIRVVEDGQLLPTAYLDVRSKITTAGGEQGLLGMAFHPDFAQNGFFYINYTDVDGNTEIERYHAEPTADVADAGSASHVIGYAQPFANHNGGNLVFGPDGMLWIGSGDGGSSGDPQGNGQRLTTLLGKMLRIDVNVAEGYAIPTDNPFAGSTVNRPEIWGIGLRNPWRYSFDHTTDLLYVGDVGQNEFEEVHVVPSDRPLVNYGWRIMEGRHCFNPAACNPAGLDIPVVEYDHDEGCSVIGGFVYRGSEVPGMVGHYFYSDLCSAFIRTFRFANGVARDQREWSTPDLGNVLSFGEDGAGELYVLSGNGTVYKIQPAGD